MTEEKRDAAELLLANRLYLYTSFYKLFAREPDAQQLELLTGEQTGAAFALLSAGEGDALSGAAAFLRSVLQRLRDAEYLEKVRDEYMHLFVGPDKLPAPPWESVYRGEDAILFQKVTLEVREAYRAFDLLPEAYPHVADDSLALELAFLTKLAEKAAQALSAGDDAALLRYLQGSEQFLQKHLLAWVPPFLVRLEKASTAYLYPPMCEILYAFLKRDRDVLTEITTALK